MGGGIFGLSVAFACARRGAAVTLIERHRIGAGASGGIVGALAPHVPENWNPKKQVQFDSLVMAEAFGREEVPEPLRSQLLRDGYLHLDAKGLFASNRYILPEQIARMTADGVQLNVTKDALIKRPN